MSIGLRLYTNLDANNQPIDPLADTADGGRSGDFLFDDKVFRGDIGDVVFARLYVDNARSDKQYLDVTLSTVDIEPNQTPLALDIGSSFQATDQSGNQITIDQSEVGTARVQYYQEENRLDIPTDPNIYTETLNIGGVGPSGGTNDTRDFFVMGVVDPLTPTSLYTDMQIEVEAKETDVS